jgi:predicted Zn finger-like uncharacterized protein
MAVTKLTCPECSTVLRPAKPVPAGKKVKCPRCDTVFEAGADEVEDDDDEVEEERPRRAPRKIPVKAREKVKKAAKDPPKKKPAATDDDDGAYGVVTDQELEENKPKIEYAPDMSVKDLRGPALAILWNPSNKLVLMAFVGVFGYLALIILLSIPALFPIIEDDKEQDVMKIGPGLSQASPWATSGSMGMLLGGGGGGDNPAPAPREEQQQGGDSGTKFVEEKASIYQIWGLDLSNLIDAGVGWFLLYMVPIILLACYAGLVAHGAIKMQNIESRRWGMAASIMALFPMNMAGTMAVTAMVLNLVLGQIMDDRQFIDVVVIIAMVAEWLLSMGMGIWCIVTLFNETVIAGFEYVAE